MTRVPTFATTIVSAAVLVMLSLGGWQLQRAEEKERLLAQYARAAALPALDLDPLLAQGRTDLPPLAFRRVLVTCRAIDAAPDLRGGRSRDGAGGYSYFLPCRPGAEGLAGRLAVNVGWTALPEQDRRLTLDGVVAGTLGSVPEQGRVVLTSAAAVPPLRASAPPSLDQVPDNHLFYAVQWFFFAAAAALIYWLALRRRLSRGG